MAVGLLFNFSDAVSFHNAGLHQAWINNVSVAYNAAQSTVIFISDTSSLHFISCRLFFSSRGSSDTPLTLETWDLGRGSVFWQEDTGYF